VNKLTQPQTEHVNSGSTNKQTNGQRGFQSSSELCRLMAGEVNADFLAGGGCYVVMAAGHHGP
jgi:hypothetical protein